MATMRQAAQVADSLFASPTALGGIVEFAVEIALGVESGGVNGAIWQPDPDGALWDTKGVWSGTQPSWVDVSSRASGVSTKRGRDRWEQQFRVGQCVAILANDDGVFNPDAEKEPGSVALRPGRWLRVLGRRTDDGSPWVPLWTGQIDSMADIYQSAAHGIDSRFISLDFGARFQIDDPPALEVAIPAGQLTSDRVEELLDLVNWPPTTEGWRDIEPGENTMAESNLAQSRWAEMQVAATAEDGALFMSAAGIPTFKSRDWLADKVGGPFKFSVGAVASDVQVLNADTDWSQQRVYGDVRMARKGGSEYRVTDPDSLSLYGPRTFRRFDIECQTDAQLIAIADRKLAVFRYDRSRVEAIDLVPTSPEGVTQLLNVELGDLIRVTVRTAGVDGWSYTDDYFVNQVNHEISADDWVTSLRVDAATFDVPLLPAAYTDGFDDGFDSQEPS